MTPRMLASLLASLVLVCSTLASAQATDYTPKITVTPLVAPPGVARTITVSGVLQIRCALGISSSLTVLEPPGGAARGPLTLNLGTFHFDPPFCFTPRDQSYSVTTTYTPTVAGRREVVMHVPGYLPGPPSPFGFGEIITRESDTMLRAGTDFTGVWYEPARNGSGFAFYHSQDESDVLAGTFYGFDNAGRPFWHLIQTVEWTSENTFQARLVQLSSAAGSCAILAGCNRVSTVAQLVGFVRGTLVNADRLQIELRSGPFPFVNNVEVDRFDLQRLKF